MYIKQLFEAPIGDLEFKGDPDKEGSFRPDDLKAFKNPKWEAKVRNAFSKTPYNINVYLYNGEEGKIPFLPTKEYPEEFKRNVRNLSILKHYSGITTKEQIRAWFGSSPPETDISIILLHNEGANRLPLTPWILGHRLGHAISFVADQQFRGISIDKDYGVLENYMFLENVYFKFEDELIKAIRSSEKYKDHIYDSKFFLSLVGRSKATRENNLNQTSEFIIELIAEYLIKGKVDFNKPDLGVQNIDLEIVIMKYRRLFNMAIKDLLDSCIGKIIVI